MIPNTHVRIARAFKGPRHTRLERIWDAIAEYAADDIRLIVEPNTGPNRVDHASVLARMWNADQESDNRYILLTEFDFLPSLDGKWLPTEELSESGAEAFGCMRAIRNSETHQLARYGRQSGAWWLLIDKYRAPADLLFRGGDDPGNTLPKQMNMELYRGTDAYPEHYGIDYPVGTHLFWSRHYNDHPENVVNDFSIGDIQNGVDLAIDLWLAEQPVEFLRILEKRTPEVLIER